MTDVLVVGSINADVIFRSSRFAAPGTTVVADEVIEAPGGKGANQAVAAARAGAVTRVVGAVGEDPAGRAQVAALVAEGIDPTSVQRTADLPTGTAFIVVVPSGENAIVVNPGANAAIAPAQVRTAVQSADAAVVLVQSEVGETIVDAAADVASSGSARLVVNNGPWRPLSARTLAAADPLVVNEHEAREACPHQPDLTGVDLADAVRDAHGSVSVVVTQGAAGAAISGNPGELRPPPEVSQVVNTTGAGDAFVGTLAAALARGATLTEAVDEGQRASALAIGRHGAR